MTTTHRVLLSAARSLLLIALCGVPSVAHAASITRGPYLQSPTPTSIIVRWRTDVPTDSRVRVGPSPGSLATTFDDAAPDTEHVVTVTGLTPDARTYYSVGSSSEVLAGDDADHYFRSPPLPGTVRPVRAWVIGDSGFANANAQAVRDAYASFNAGNETDLFLLLGDNAYFLGTDADYQAALFDMHAALLRNVAPWSTFGNHEGFSSNSLNETGPYFQMFSFPRAGEAGGVPSGTESYYSFDFANIHFIVLDGHASSTAAGSPMVTWLEADLQATSADWVIAMWHQPPYSKGLLHDSDVEGREIRMREDVVPILEDYGVDLVLCGHSHSYERSYLLDGHYGFSPTLTPDMVLDSGDGDPLGDGAYRKASVGPAPHEGAVYVVAGSSSEVRTTTLNHPAMKVGLLELGSLVLDVDGNRLAGSFLNGLEQVTDTFTIEKDRPACPATRRTGCAAAGRSTLMLRNQADDARDRLAWRWTQGALLAADVGDPTVQTNLALCLYDQGGRLLGGSLPPGSSTSPRRAWVRRAGGVLAYDAPGAEAAGIVNVRLRAAPGKPSLISARGKGAGLGGVPLPLALPVTAQLANLDGGACWESTFTSALRNEPARFVARLP